MMGAGKKLLGFLHCIFVHRFLLRLIFIFFEVDAALFGVLAQIVYAPYEFPQKQLILNELHNLQDYCDRIRGKLWYNFSKIFEEDFFSAHNAQIYILFLLLTLQKKFKQKILKAGNRVADALSNIFFEF